MFSLFALATTCLRPLATTCLRPVAEAQCLQFPQALRIWGLFFFRLAALAHDDKERLCLGAGDVDEQACDSVPLDDDAVKRRIYLGLFPRFGGEFRRN